MRVRSVAHRGFSLITLALVAGVAVAFAGDRRVPPATFYQDVLPIVQAKCQACHRPGGLNLGGMVAPFALTSYDDVRRRAQKIKRVVQDGTMPPWHAASEFHGKFENERYLTADEIRTIVSWIDGGMPEGDRSRAPAPLTFAKAASGWSIGTPDLVLPLPEPYFVHDSIQDEYKDIKFLIPKDKLPEDRWIKAIEFRPGSKVVHHIIAFNGRKMLGGIAPGYESKIYRAGYSDLLRVGDTLRFQMHYHKESGHSTGVHDQSEMAVIFYKPGEKIRHVVETEALGMYDFKIPPGEASYSDTISYTFEKEFQLLAMNPHMHLRGKAARYVLHRADGRQEVLLEVPRYDFNWQHTYRFREPVIVQKGSRIHLTLWWDNSAANEANPNPSDTVKWGEPTTAEMGFGWLAIAEVEPRDITVGEAIPADLPRARPFDRRPRRPRPAARDTTVKDSTAPKKPPADSTQKKPPA